MRLGMGHDASTATGNLLVDHYEGTTVPSFFLRRGLTRYKIVCDAFLRFLNLVEKTND